MSTLLYLLLRKSSQLLMMTVVVGSLCFVMMRLLPGDVATRIAAGRYGYDMVSNAAADAVRLELGLDLPAWQAWGQWLYQLMTGHLGVSMVTGQTVWQEVSAQLGATLWLTGMTTVMALVVGLPLGMVAAMKPGGLCDRFTLLWAVVMRSMPPFLIAFVLMMVIAVSWGVLPVASDGHADGVWLPALTLSLGLSAGLARMVRDALVAFKLSSAWQFARSKGLSDNQVMARHGVRHTAVTVVSYIGIQAALLVEGAVVVETVFAWPGIGHALVHAVFGRDIPMIQGAALSIGALFVLWSTVTDALCLVLDPRQRHRA